MTAITFFIGAPQNSIMTLMASRSFIARSFHSPLTLLFSAVLFVGHLVHPLNRWSVPRPLYSE